MAIWHYIIGAQRFELTWQYHLFGYSLHQRKALCLIF